VNSLDDESEDRNQVQQPFHTVLVGCDVDAETSLQEFASGELGDFPEIGLACSSSFLFFPGGELKRLARFALVIEIEAVPAVMGCLSPCHEATDPAASVGIFVGWHDASFLEDPFPFRGETPVGV
jgi:hypothetical protein